MKGKEKKEKLEKNKNNRKVRKKIKRQVSIFTVMLWVFLITTMITITVNSTKKTNALEVEDENWNIQLVMYDRSSDTPEQAITEFTWNAVRYNETKPLCMQINYACTTNKGYQPGELEITIPGISKDSFSEYWRNIPHYQSSYDEWISQNITVAADRIESSIKKYDWSYTYDSENNIYIFINNTQIEENEHFEGTIQIVYNLVPRLRAKIDLEFRAKIKENIENSEEIITNQSNKCDFHYTSIKKEYSLKKYGSSAARADYTNVEEILNDYYWVRYSFSIREDNGIIQAYEYDNNIIYSSSTCFCIKEELPDGCVLYNKNLEKIEPKENNTYYLSPGPSSSHYYYVGYPKNKYNEGDSITNTVELWGRYEDEDEMQKINEASATVSLVDFDFEYKGDLYDIIKDGRNR